MHRCHAQCQPLEMRSDALLTLLIVTSVVSFVPTLFLQNIRVRRSANTSKVEAEGPTEYVAVRVHMKPGLIADPTNCALRMHSVYRCCFFCRTHKFTNISSILSPAQRKFQQVVRRQGQGHAKREGTSSIKLQRNISVTLSTVGATRGQFFN